jgi:hypothetical protein
LIPIAGKIAVCLTGLFFTGLLDFPQLKQGIYFTER